MSRDNTYNLGESIYFHFTIYDVDSETPLSGEEQVNFTFTLMRNTLPVEVPPVAVAECGSSGTYYAYIIPVETGTYQLRIIGDNDTVRVWHTFNFEVIAANSGLSIIEDILKNKLTISTATPSGTYYQQVWDDDGANVLLQWQLYDKDDLDIVITGRGPVSRGLPSGG